MSAEKDELILEFDPFEGDFGDQSDRVFSNKMVVARKEKPCMHCGEQIKTRSQTAKGLKQGVTS